MRYLLIFHQGRLMSTVWPPVATGILVTDWNLTPAYDISLISILSKYCLIWQLKPVYTNILWLLYKKMANSRWFFCIHHKDLVIAKNLCQETSKTWTNNQTHAPGCTNLKWNNEVRIYLFWMMQQKNEKYTKSHEGKSYNRYSYSSMFFSANFWNIGLQDTIF